MPRDRHSPAPSKVARLFRNNRSQAVRIPVEFELPGEKVLISRDGDRLIIEPVRKAGLAALLAQWAKEPPLGPEDDFPEIDDKPVEPEDIL
ncbi:antitoxin [Mesorhizobium sp.]|uniref:antitoxin n=1 Tax=Mesorhizobium sp. TaxID=1871066 RepID=UPI003BABBE1F